MFVSEQEGDAEFVSPSILNLNPAMMWRCSLSTIKLAVLFQFTYVDSLRWRMRSLGVKVVQKARVHKGSPPECFLRTVGVLSFSE